MKNLIIEAGAASDIESQVNRLLRDLGYGGGKVELREVRELLKLDLQFYSLEDPTLAEEVIHKLRIGGKQVMARPALLLEAIQKMELRALFLPDRKRILLDDATPDIKKRWAEAHEISHSITPWHSDYMLGDTQQTLSPGCQAIIEAEANFGAGRLLFPTAHFSEVRLSEDLGMAHVRALAKQFGNTITSTLWRCVEDSDSLIFGTVGQNPKTAVTSDPMITYFIRSLPFASQFANINEDDLVQQINKCCGFQRKGPLGTVEFFLEDINTICHAFVMEAFSNGYQVLTLARHVGLRNARISITA